jgi:hypothetical protein
MTSAAFSSILAKVENPLMSNMAIDPTKYMSSVRNMRTVPYGFSKKYQFLLISNMAIGSMNYVLSMYE